MSRKKEVNAGKIISTILSFLQSIFLFAFFGVLIFYFSFLHEGSILNSMERANYYDGVYEHIKESAQDILLPTGLPDSILEGAIDALQVKEDVRNDIKGELSGNLYTIDQSSIAEKLKANIHNYLENEGIETSEGAVDEIVQVIVETYTSSIQFPFMSHIARLVQVYRLLMMVVVAGSFILSMITGLLIYRINRWKHRAFRYYAYSLGGCAFMLTAAPLAVKIWGIYGRIAVTPAFAYNFLVTHIERGLWIFLISGIILIVLEIIFAGISTSLLYKVKHIRKSVHSAW